MVFTRASITDTVIPIGSARSETDAVTASDRPSGDPLKLATLLVQATWYGIGADAAEQALSQVFTVAVSNGAARWAGVTQLDGDGTLTTAAASNELVRTADHLQAEYAEGPGFAAASGGHEAMGTN